MVSQRVRHDGSYLAHMGLCCFLEFSLVVASGSHSLVVASGLLIEVASLVEGRGL